MDKQLLQQMVDDGLVSVQKHPFADLFIYNYTPKVQYGRMWNEITLQARGLILDANGNVVARPFRKFFNIEEHAEGDMPKLPFDVYDKVDGSLGILYWVDDKPLIATRGSFTSEQAKRGTVTLYCKYSSLFNELDKNSTYLFEIIYPENRIVVDYGKMDDLVLLSIIDNSTGEERIENIGFPVVKKFDGINEINQLKTLEEDNKEGFVIRFKNGFRVKMKFSEYVRLHRIITGVSNVVVWEHLFNDESFDGLLERVPDEFYDWVKKTKEELCNKFDEILSECKLAYKELQTRKESALYFQTQKYPAVLFSMLNKKSPNKIIWKMIRPKYSKPFKNND